MIFNWYVKISVDEPIVFCFRPSVVIKKKIINELNFTFSFPYYRFSFVIHYFINYYQCFLLLLSLFTFMFFFALPFPCSCFPFFLFLKPFILHFTYIWLSGILSILSQSLRELPTIVRKEHGGNNVNLSDKIVYWVKHYIGYLKRSVDEYLLGKCYTAVDKSLITPQWYYWSDIKESGVYLLDFFFIFLSK